MPAQPPFPDFDFQSLLKERLSALDQNRVASIFKDLGLDESLLTQLGQLLAEDPSMSLTNEELPVASAEMHEEINTTIKWLANFLGELSHFETQRFLERFLIGNTYSFEGQESFKLSVLKNNDPSVIVEKVFKHLSELLEAANGLSSLEVEGMNDHGMHHIRKAIRYLERLVTLIETNLKVSLTRDTLVQVTLAVLFHDIGMMFGRENHGQTSVQMVRVMIPDWDPQDPWCQRVEYLILNHQNDFATSALTQNSPMGDPQLAMVVMVDELDLGNRLSPLYRREGESKVVIYQLDPWFRIAQDVITSQIDFNPENQEVTWAIVAVEPENQPRKNLEISSSLQDDILEKVFMYAKKLTFLKSFQAIFGPEIAVKVRLIEGEQNQEILTLRSNV